MAKLPHSQSLRSQLLSLPVGIIRCGRRVGALERSLGTLKHARTSTRDRTEDNGFGDRRVTATPWTYLEDYSRLSWAPPSPFASPEHGQSPLG